MQSGMSETEKAIENLNTAKLILCNPQMLTPEMCIRIGQAVTDAIELLKEREAIVKQWTKEIADNQLAHAPKDFNELMSLDEHLDNEYKRGIWDGLQIAWNIISEGR